MSEVKRRNPARPKKDAKSAATKTGAKNQHPKKSTTQHTITLDGNAIKYIARHKYKGDSIQDIEKAIWYLQRHLDNLKAKSK